MKYQNVFKRYEYKYLLNEVEKAAVMDTLDNYMMLDRYGIATIRNIYFDTDNYRLIRCSIEKPIYKEKLRLRCYNQAFPEHKCFVELKKKYDSVVYKRRLLLPEKEAVDWVTGKKHCGSSTQISREIDYFIDYYQTLTPKVFLSYDRKAYCEKNGGNFRVTFDENILARENDLSLGSEIYGIPILPKGVTLMEIKCSGGIPLWMVHTLSKNKIYKTSFSKYGMAYQQQIFPKTNENQLRKELKINA